MKRLVLTLTLASLAALPPVGAAAPRARQCPGLSVSCPDMIRGGVPVTFTVNVGDVPGDAKLTFNWVVSDGTISSGQGTTSVTVDTTGLSPGSTVKATVEVGGLPESCPKSAECTAATPPPCYRSKIDEYGNLRWGDEQARLDNFAIELLNDPEAVGYIVGYGGRRSLRGEASRRIERAKKYLTAVRAVPAERVVTMDAGYREYLTVELMVGMKGATPPAPSPTVDPREVVIIKRAAARKPRRR